jgi:hypothetical protein
VSDGTNKKQVNDNEDDEEDISVDEDDEEDISVDEDDEEDISVDEDDATFRYKYLDKENYPLSQFFGDFIDTDNSYKIFVCIYKINVECKLPFLEFLIDISNNPSFPIINDFVCRKGDDEEQNIDFRNKCIVEVLNRLEINDIFGVELLEKMYKGFIEYNDDNIFVVFECPDHNQAISKESKWSILAEIIDDQTEKIDPIIKSFLTENTFMTEIRNENDEIIQSPLSLYLCTDTEKEITSIVDTTIKHDWLGDCYLFVSNSHDTTNTQKYAVFTEKTKYILTDINAINEKQINDFISDSSESVVLSIYYHKNNIQYWCIRNNNNFTRI